MIIVTKRAELKDRLREAMDRKGVKAIELATALDIPRSAVSQYLSGKSKNMDSKRLHAMCKYLNVSEAWLIGFDVPIGKTLSQIKNDTVSDVVVRMKSDSDFFLLIEAINKLDDNAFKAVRMMVLALYKNSLD